MILWKKKQSFYRKNEFVLFLLFVIIVGLVMINFSFDIVGQFVNPVDTEDDIEPSETEVEEVFEEIVEKISETSDPEKTSSGGYPTKSSGSVGSGTSSEVSGIQKVGTVSVNAGGSTPLGTLSVG